MAELQASNHDRKPGVKRGKKLSTRVDLTPMVDLGFLLITFFVFTTSLSQTRTMNLVMPDDRPTPTPTTSPESKTISFLLGNDNRVYVYEGLALSSMMATSYASTGIRKVLQDKRNQVMQKGGRADEVVVLIKPTDGANFNNVVNMLDEILINDIKKYALMEPSPDELEQVATKNG